MAFAYSLEVATSDLNGARRDSMLRGGRDNGELRRGARDFSTQDLASCLDAPLVGGSGPVAAMLRALVEATGDRVGVECCLATVALDGRPRAIEAVAPPDPTRPWTRFSRWLDLCGIYDLLHRSNGVVRMDGEALGREPAFRMAALELPLRGWLAASLTTANGSVLGAIQLFDKRNGDFTAGDEAHLIYLAARVSSALQTRWLR